MNKVTQPSAPKSASNLVKESREAIEAMSTKQPEKAKLTVKSARKGMCVFGKPNPNFNKHNI